MKKIITYLLLIGFFYINARIGCMDNSWYLTKHYDDKEMHYVSCDCNCTNTLGACPLCGHIHQAQPWTIIEKNNTKTKQINTAVTIPPTMQQTVTRMIALHKQLSNIRNEQ